MYSKIIEPFSSLFTKLQIQTLLLAWLPTKLEPLLTGIITVDIFITTILASGITTLGHLIYAYSYNNISEHLWDKSVVVQVEKFAKGPYNERYINNIYEALSWLISQQTKGLKSGSFVAKLHPSISNTSKGGEFITPDFNILPDNDQEIFIEYEGNKFKTKYKVPDDLKNKIVNQENFVELHPTKPLPSIFLSNIDNSNVKAIYDFLSDLTSKYLELQKKSSSRYRYENNESRWSKIQILSSCRGLDSVALDEKNEVLLNKELEMFINDKEFYERVGMPYRRGILLYGKPGTGKTSLINAIASHLTRDIYFLNLKKIKDDNELSTLFSSVPSNQMIVLEDVDTQSSVLLKRNYKPLLNFKKKNKNKETNLKENIDYGDFSLSTFLNCLDGHILSEGILIIMTTNHVECLDPACIRPGRMDLHLELGYCTHYQIEKLFKTVVHSDNSKIMLKVVPEELIPPCEVMTLMTLYRNDDIEIINEMIIKLTMKWQNLHEHGQNILEI